MIRLLAMSISTALVFFLSTSGKADEFPQVFNTQEAGQQPPAPDQAASLWEVPEGFRVMLFAGEPDVQQPICFAFDDRGRMLVAECYTYTSKLFEQKLADRIIILHDTDGDGRHDVRKVFWQGGNALTSVAWGFGGIFMLENGKLQHVPDENRDDVPDGPPVVLLDGFDLLDVGHNVVNGLIWGPDGWLYGRHGIQGTSHVGPPDATPDERVNLNASIWRYHPSSKKFEVLTHGTTNPWGMDYNEHGEFFFTNNVIGHLWHMVPGAHYERMYGTDFNPHVYELIDQTADHYHWDHGTGSWQDSRDTSRIHGQLGGGHSHCGGMIYLGDNWPDEYRGRMFLCNTHGRRINQDILQRRGVGHVAKHAPDFAAAGNEWFRGVQLGYGPDGGVFVSDWSDLGECHDSDGVHRTSGRIYKITYGKPNAVDPKLDVAALSNTQLVELQFHKNDWYSRHARRVLQERAARGDDISDTAAALAETISADAKPRDMLRTLWAYYAIGKADNDVLASIFGKSESEHVKAWVFRLMGDLGMARSMAEIASLEDVESLIPPLARLQLASNLQRMEAVDAMRLSKALATVGADSDDPVQPLMIYYGMEPHIGSHWLHALQTIESTQMGTLRRLIARRLTSEIDESPSVINTLLETIQPLTDSDGNTTARSVDVLQGIAEALRGRTKVAMPTAWPAAVERIAASANEQAIALAQELSVVFGDGRAIEGLIDIVRDPNLDAAQRRQALATLAENRVNGLETELFAALGDHALAPVAARGLANYDHSDTPRQLLRKWRGMKADARPEVVNTLCSRPEYAITLLRAIKRDNVPATALNVIHARQLDALGHPRVSKLLAEVWGSVRTTPAEKHAEIERFKGVLTDELISTANVQDGRKVFQSKCANCHKMFGEGETIGPDLTGSDRRNLHYVLENIIDPSAVVPAAHRMSIITTESGRTITGVVLDQDEQRVTVQTEKEQLVLPRDDVEEIGQTEVSLMPEGLLKDLSQEEIRDLVAFLRM